MKFILFIFALTLSSAVIAQDSHQSIMFQHQQSTYKLTPDQEQIEPWRLQAATNLRASAVLTMVSFGVAAGGLALIGFTDHSAVGWLAIGTVPVFMFAAQIKLHTAADKLQGRNIR